MSEAGNPSRRSALGALAGAAALAFPAAAAAAEDDTEILALATEIQRLEDVRADIHVKRFMPLDYEFGALVKVDWKTAVDFSETSGREAAIKEMDVILSQIDHLLDRMRTLPALTQAGRAAKVRVILGCALGEEWRGRGRDLDWDKDHARALLGEFAGMNEDEIAAV
jgi:hypothetical protein